jgi:hypothetical protein
MEGAPMFTFQRKTGSTRVAETSDGRMLFSIKNASFYIFPQWVLNVTEVGKVRTTEYKACADAALENIVVTYGDGEKKGVQVASVRCVGGHTVRLATPKPCSNEN